LQQIIHGLLLAPILGHATCQAVKMRHDRPADEHRRKADERRTGDAPVRKKTAASIARTFN
jgi:hypothetical protein